mmetsp:Transcript_71649/g.116155  ORF Transcript_71649/g.116155 Transcript_71649/m.116155 type:complete len:208 (+) Transcript_71649:155-778(+)
MFLVILASYSMPGVCCASPLKTTSCCSHMAPSTSSSCPPAFSPVPCCSSAEESWIAGEPRELTSLDLTPDSIRGHSVARKPLVPTLIMTGRHRRTLATNPCLANQPSYTSCSSLSDAPASTHGTPSDPTPTPSNPGGVSWGVSVTRARQKTLYAGAVEFICSRPLEISERISFLEQFVTKSGFLLLAGKVGATMSSTTSSSHSMRRM